MLGKIGLVGSRGMVESPEDISAAGTDFSPVRPGAGVVDEIRRSVRAPEIIDPGLADQLGRIERWRPGPCSAATAMSEAGATRREVGERARAKTGWSSPRCVGWRSAAT